MSSFSCTVVKVLVKDGTLFDSYEKAEAYVVDAICEDINEILKTQKYYDIKYQDLVKIITALSGTIENAERLKNVLDKYLD
jgi:hypothetical protein